jgi:hypothetical protein
VPGMNMFWMIATLVAVLSVIVASVAAAVTADAVSRRPRRQLPRRADISGSEPRARVLTAEAMSAGRDWSRIATAAWTLCVAASVLAVAFIGVLILVG